MAQEHIVKMVETILKMRMNTTRKTNLKKETLEKEQEKKKNQQKPRNQSEIFSSKLLRKKSKNKKQTQEKMMLWTTFLESWIQVLQHLRFNLKQCPFPEKFKRQSKKNLMMTL